MRLLFVFLTVALLAGCAHDESYSLLSPEPNGETTMKTIQSVTITEHEEEGGYMSVTYYPSGYARVEGKLGSGGYTPHLKNGWYAVVNVSALKDIFRDAQRKLDTAPKTGNQTNKDIKYGTWQTVGVVANNQTFTLEDTDFGTTDPLVKNEPQSGGVLLEPVAPKPIDNLNSTVDYAAKPRKI